MKYFERRAERAFENLLAHAKTTNSNLLLLTIPDRLRCLEF